MKVVDITQHRERKEREYAAKSVKRVGAAIQDMKDDIMVAVNTSIDGLVKAGMDEDKATLVVMTYLGDLVMADDLGHEI